MHAEWVRQFCLALPQTTEEMQWGDHLLFKVGGKMYVITSLEPGKGNFLSLKADPEEFAELTERPGVVPAPYLARAKWVALEEEDSLPRAEICRLLRRSYELVAAKLPKKLRTQLSL